LHSATAIYGDRVPVLTTSRREDTMSVVTDNPRPAEAFPVGEYLSDELRERGWAVVEFAEILGRPFQAVSEILNGHKEITPTTAKEIAAATGTSAETWLRLQDTYRLWKLSPITAGRQTD
jgi:HTH-type transcriptional regulator/antitoxin HigA